MARTFVLASFLFFSGSLTFAQTVGECSGLRCLMYGLYGSSGLRLPSFTHGADFTSAFSTEFGAINTALANQLTSLPIPSPASGITYTLTAQGTLSRSVQSLGPIFTERSETIGKNRLNLGFAYQHFSFDSVDGLELNNLPAVFEHQDVSGDNLFENDVITTTNSIDLTVDQSIFFVSYGLTNWMDVSVALPIVRTELSVVSNAVIQRIGSIVDDPDTHEFDPSTSSQSFSDSGTATGLGDIILRVKARPTSWENGGVALGMDVLFPTGDEDDLLGSGAYAVRPFAAASLRYKQVTPHFNIGYQWTGDSILADNAFSQTDPLTGVTTLFFPDEKLDLPNRLTYGGGTDIGLSPNFTFAIDLLGQVIFDGVAVEPVQFVANQVPGSPLSGAVFPNIQFVEKTLHIFDLAAGFKFNPVANLLFTFNALIKLNDAGLRDNFTPLVGVEYSFP